MTTPQKRAPGAPSVAPAPMTVLEAILDLTQADAARLVDLSGGRQRDVVSLKPGDDGGLPLPDLEGGEIPDDGNWHPLKAAQPESTGDAPSHQTHALLLPLSPYGGHDLSLALFKNVRPDALSAETQRVLPILAGALVHSVANDNARAPVAQSAAAADAFQETPTVHDRFLQTINHEIRTPLNALLGFGELLEQTHLTRDQEKLVESMCQSGQELLTLLSTIINYATHDSQEAKPSATDGRLPDVLSEIIAGTRERYGSLTRRIRFDLTIDPSLPDWIRCDWDSLRTILEALYSNAVKFTARGRIGLSVSAPNQPAQNTDLLLEFQVKDTGFGISADDLPRVFEPYYRVDPSMTRPFGGLGLGLSLAQKLVEARGGTIRLESKIDSGTSVYFSFPCQAVHEPARSSKTISDAPEKRPDRILIVEDNLANQVFAQQALESLGFECTLATNGVDAVDRLMEICFSAVLMDVEMPIMDGIEATRIIRRMTNANRTVPIVALTAHAAAGDRKRLLDAGMDAYLAKPVSIGKLERILDNLGDELSARVGLSLDDPSTAHSPIPDALDLRHLDELRAFMPPDRLKATLMRGWAATREHIDDLLPGAETLPPEKIAHLAHQIAGLAANVGVARLSALARNLEGTPDDRTPIATMAEQLQATETALFAYLEQAVAPSTTDRPPNPRDQRVGQPHVDQG